MNGSRINRRNLIGAAALIATGLSTRAHSVSQGASNRISRPTSKIKGEYVFPDAPQPNVIVMGAQSGRSNPVIVHQDSPEPITTFVIPVLKYSDGAAARKHDH
jgi:hypothetical protein